MKQAYGLSIPQTLEDIVQPSRCGLIVYDMQSGIVPQIPSGLEIRDRCASILSAARKAKTVDGKPNALSYSFSTNEYSAEFTLTILSPSRAEATGTKNYKAASDDPIKSSSHHYETKYQSSNCDGLAAGGLQIWMVNRWVPMARL